MSPLPTFLPRESFVQQRQDFCNVELHIFEIEVVLVVFLHLEQVVKLQIELK
jgi:hypothetical protein